LIKQRLREMTDTSTTDAVNTLVTAVTDPTDDTLVADMIKSTYAHYIIFGCALFACAWAGWCTFMVTRVEVKAENVKPNEDETERADPSMADMPWDKEECTARMLLTNQYIKDGAKTFLKKEYTYLSIFCVLFSILLLCVVDMPWKSTNLPVPYTTISFLVGAGTSMLAGYLGMMIATTANVKVTYLCNINIQDAFNVAFNGGQVLGFGLVGLALIFLEILILSYTPSVMGVLGTNATK